MGKVKMKAKERKEFKKQLNAQPETIWKAIEYSPPKQFKCCFFD